MPVLTPEQKKDLRQFVLQHLGDLYRVAFSLCHDRNGAEEIVAETIAKACESFSGLRDRSKVKQWFLRILSNTFINERRYNKLHKTSELIEKEDDEISFSLFEKLESSLRSTYNPEQEIISKLVDDDIQKAIAELPEDFRIAVVLCDVEGYSYKETAKVLQIPVGTVRSRIARGRALLQKQLWYYVQDLNLFPKRKIEKKTEGYNEKKAGCNC